MGRITRFIICLRSGRLPIRCERGRPGASVWGEPVLRTRLMAPSGDSMDCPFALSAPFTQASAPVTIGDALEVPLKRSVYQRS